MKLNNIGNWEIIPLETGTFKLDGGAMMGSVPKVLWEKTNPADEFNRIDLSLRCLLLKKDDKCVLVETGVGDKNAQKFLDMFAVEKEESALSKALSECGLYMENITDVVLTHLHFDHAGGATSIGESGDIIPAFPCATYHISQRNWEAGIAPNPRDRASYLSENYLPLLENGVVNLIEDNGEILDGITAYTVDGHTTGQQLIKIEDSGETLVFCSDLIPLKSHLKLPWIMGYDLHAYKTLLEKTEFLEIAERENWWLYFYHDPKTIAVKICKDEKYYSIIEEVFADE